MAAELRRAARWLARLRFHDQLPQYDFRDIERVADAIVTDLVRRKSHVYATVFYDPCRRNVISMVQGRDKETVYTFIRSMGKPWCEAVEIVTADLWRAYKTTLRNAESILAYTGHLRPYPAPNIFCDD